MKLYYFAGACSLADHIVLEWVGAPYETVRLDHAALKSPEFLALNPNGAVPLLIDGDYVLTQNVAILCYLAERYPAARVFAGTPRGRAEVMRWLGFLNSDVHPAFKPIFVPQRFLPDPAVSGAIADTARGHVRTYLGRLDVRLEGRDWLVDERSIADPYLFVMLRWAIRLKIGLDGFGNLTRFLERMLADDGVRAALVAEEGASVLDASRQPWEDARLQSAASSRATGAHPP
ncbi:MAG TPA: glutathione binding-like protein [Steroidobacteraceae bacterium]|nr:glutathione binding-like protein [Steroidobacteraceae bacterium]